MTSKRAFGALRKLPSGRYQAKWREFTGGPFVTAPRTFERKGDATRYLAKIEADLARGVYVDPNDPVPTKTRRTVRTYGREFLAAHLQTKAPSTVASYEGVWRRQIESEFGSLRLTEVKPTMVRIWIASMSRRHLSPSAVRQAYRLLSLILDAAVSDGEIGANPCASVKRVLPRMPEPSPVIVTPEDVARLREAIREPYGLAVDLMAYAGLRIGELFALRRRSVDPLGRRLVVKESVTEANGVKTFKAPKSHQQRDVTLPAFLVADLAAHLATMPADPRALLFPSRNGGPLTYAAFRRSAWDPAIAECGLDITPHSLRASCASWVAAEHGVLEAAKRLGHSQASVTTAHYARTLPDGDGKVADSLERLRHVRP